MIIIILQGERHLCGKKLILKILTTLDTGELHLLLSRYNCCDCECIINMSIVNKLMYQWLNKENKDNRCFNGALRTESAKSHKIHQIFGLCV